MPPAELVAELRELVESVPEEFRRFAEAVAVGWVGPIQTR